MEPSLPNDDPFARRLAEARELRRISQSDLAKIVGIPASSISHFEAGTRKPSFDNLRKLANALSVSTDFLLGRVEAHTLAAEADILHRDAQFLNAQDRALAQEFIKLLNSRSSRP